ncbi:Tannase/feruloyl esterase [Hypoxylon argillaceum]|nr:Tannase/feruloyl esterase [Hypoxylon argillaceum]
MVPPTLCTANTFTALGLFGAKVLTLDATLVRNFSRYVSDQDYVNNPESFVQNATFCNVTISYTHPGQQDCVTVEAWLPLPWNGRLQAVGGGGWTADATITTDAGLGAYQFPTDWALLSPGNVNLYALQNLGSVSLNEQGFYGQPPRYSYFNGCSQGGRQALQLAQRYPDAYDGIAAATPAVYWPQFFQAMLWSQLVMNDINEYPYGCELDYLQSAVISKCDGDDGIVDGIIMDPDSCIFNPFSLVGASFHCNETGHDMLLSRGAAVIFDAYHTGARGPNNEFLWYGPHYGANLTHTIFGTPSLAATNCMNGTCVGSPFAYGLFWVGLFGEKDPAWDFGSMTNEMYSRVFHLASQEYASIFGTVDPDLSLFSQAGGKMISYHGLADELCPTKGTEKYYNEVMKLTPDVHDFYRYFEVPGLGHCYGGNGGQPIHVFEALRAWVENGIAPDSIPIEVPRTGPSETRLLCPYPQKTRTRVGANQGDNSTVFYCST